MCIPALVGNVRANQAADSRRVHVSDIGQIDDEQLGIVRSHQVLELEEIRQRYRSCERKYPGVRAVTGTRFDNQLLIRHIAEFYGTHSIGMIKR